MIFLKLLKETYAISGGNSEGSHQSESWGHGKAAGRIKKHSHWGPLAHHQPTGPGVARDSGLPSTRSFFSVIISYQIGAVSRDKTMSGFQRTWTNSMLTHLKS